MDTENFTEGLDAGAVLQTNVAKGIMHVSSNLGNLFKFFFPEDPGKEGKDTILLAELAAEVISRLKTAEILVLRGLLIFAEESGAPAEGVATFHRVCGDLTVGLMLINNLITVDELHKSVKSGDIEVGVNAYNASLGKDLKSEPDLHVLTEELKGFLEKIRASKEDPTSIQ